MTSNSDLRKLMKQAIEAMTRSVPERRGDGKVAPLVGAVLVLPNGSVDAASRGELRDGDHAEFALLERKNRSTILDGATLFTTLEPCAPGARKHPKLSCAERIVLARIRKVWVGIADPDPTVDRKGIKFLQDNGVTVEMFDRDLQDEIQDANKEFLDQALDRAAAAVEDEPTPEVILSELALALPEAHLSDLSDSALQRYQSAVSQQSPLTVPDLHRRLLQLRVLQRSRSALVPTGYGLILFGKEPRLQLPGAALLATIHLSNGQEEIQTFDGPALEIPGQALDWLRAKLPNAINRSQAKRQDSAIFTLIREGIVNALVHRDYDLPGAKCQLIVRDGLIEILSPGEPVAPISLEQLQSLNAPMLSRNPVLHYVFNAVGLAEERGLGLKSMRTLAQSAGLPLPSFSFRAPYVVLTIYSDSQALLATRGADLSSTLSAAERQGWEWVSTQDAVSTAEYQDAMNVPNRTAKNHISKFVDLGLLIMKGRGRATRYQVVR